jgi:hypothetical protein
MGSGLQLDNAFLEVRILVIACPQSYTPDHPIALFVWLVSLLLPIVRFSS